MEWNPFHTDRFPVGATKWPPPEMESVHGTKQTQAL
jgi:hypothetical protein